MGDQEGGAAASASPPPNTPTLAGFPGGWGVEGGGVGVGGESWARLTRGSEPLRLIESSGASSGHVKSQEVSTLRSHSGQEGCEVLFFFLNCWTLIGPPPPQWPLGLTHPGSSLDKQAANRTMSDSHRRAETPANGRPRCRVARQLALALASDLLDAGRARLASSSAPVALN